MLTKIQQDLLEKISDLHKIPTGAIAIRVNGKTTEIKSTKEIEIAQKTNKKGLDIFIHSNTKQKSLHIPVLIDNNGTKETVYNDFYIENNADITIIAGCGIHTNKHNAKHNGIHCLHIGNNCNVKYIERHIGLGVKTSQKELSPTTKIEMGENSILEMETTQLGGVKTANRKTFASVNKNSKIIIKEKILTNNNDSANSVFNIKLNGQKSSVDIVSRVVAKNKSIQNFFSTIEGKNECFGRVECDGIIFDKAKILSTPALKVLHQDATLSHEAQIGKIAGDELIKLMTLGLSKDEAEQKIIAGYLK